MDPGENLQVVLDDAAVGWVNLFLLLDDPAAPWGFLFSPLGLLGCKSGTYKGAVSEIGSIPFAPCCIKLLEDCKLKHSNICSL